MNLFTKTSMVFLAPCNCLQQRYLGRREETPHVSIACCQRLRYRHSTVKTRTPMYFWFGLVCCVPHPQVGRVQLFSAVSYSFTREGLCPHPIPSRELDSGPAHLFPPPLSSFLVGTNVFVFIFVPLAECLAHSRSSGYIG